MVAPRMENPVPETGIFGVGWAADATGQTQLVSEVQDALRHMPPTQTSPSVQSALSVQELLQPAGGTGVAVGALYAV